MNDRQRSQTTLRYAGLATQWMVLMGVSAWGGYKIDKLIGWKFPLLLIVFALGALAFSFWQLLNELNKKGK